MKQKFATSPRPIANNGRAVTEKLHRRLATTTQLYSFNTFLNVAIEAGVIYCNPRSGFETGANSRALFQRMRSERVDESPAAPVFRVGECQKALDRACNKVGTGRITHHDPQHLFATRCIESGVDVPTVSRWLGIRMAAH